MSEHISITFILPDGSELPCKAAIGETVLSVAKKHDLNLEGACGGCLACATCHVIVDDSFYDKLPEVSPDEDEMLDMAFSVAKCSRLGCQIKLVEALDGIRVRIPDSGD